MMRNAASTKLLKKKKRNHIGSASEITQIVLFINLKDYSNLDNRTGLLPHLGFAKAKTFGISYL